MAIHIIDAICGQGKTTAMINKINRDKTDNKYLYITPFLTEVERIKDNCLEKKFKEPIAIKKTKTEDIKRLFERKENIVSTHALFRKLNEDSLEVIKKGNYTLVMDEVADVVEVLEISKNDMETILEKYCVITESGNLEWTAKDYEGKFEEYKRIIEMDSVCPYIDGSGKCVALLWLFPIDIFKSFKDIYILTYMFKGQIQKYYFDLYNLKYDYLYVEDFQITNKEIKYNEREIKNLIKICEKESLNKIGDNVSSLSSTWFEKNKNTKLMKQLKNNTYNFFRNISKTGIKNNLWTSFKTSKLELKGKGYSTSFLSLNIRATNLYKDKTAVAYLINKYMNPILKNFFLQKEIIVNEDAYALSEMIQFLFRGSIRKKEEMTVYVPSSRMRKLLKNWINKK